MTLGTISDDSRRASTRRWLRIFVLGAVFSAEMAVFCWGTSRHVAWIYPRWLDQNQYLTQAYDAYRQGQAHGLAGFANAVNAHDSPQGALHEILACAVFSVAGPSRLSALAVNLLAFLALQMATFAAVRRISNSDALAAAAMALLATLAIPWSGDAGSATDFRLDWMAACAYGVALAVAVMGNGFKSTRWATLLGIAVGFVLLTRFLTAVYLLIVFAGLFAWLITQPGAGRRCARLLLSAAIAGGIAGCVFWKRRRAIYDYYWMGQFDGPEAALRKNHWGIAGSLKWIVSEILFRELGFVCLGVAVAAALLFFLTRAKREASQDLPGTRRDVWVVALLFFAAPVVVLVLHPAQANPPLAIVVAPLVWFIVLAWLHLAKNPAGRSFFSVCLGVCVVCAGMFLERQSRAMDSSDRTKEFRAINGLSDFLYFRAEEAGLATPRVSSTGISDCLNGDAFRLVGYERHHRMVAFVPILPTGIVEVDPASVLARLGESDFVCLITRGPAIWPVDREMRTLLPKTRQWCEKNLVHDGDIETNEFAASIYEKRGLPAPEEGRGVRLGTLLAMAQEGQPYAKQEPPAPAYVVDAGIPVLWSDKVPVSYRPKAAYSPYTLHALEMPAGLVLDERAGQVTGRFSNAGNFLLALEVSNARGSSRGTIAFRVVDEEQAAELSAPRSCRVGTSVDLLFGAFDSGGKLDFIDFTDVTAGKVLTRLAAREDERTGWGGRLRVVFAEPGRHRIIARTVRFYPETKEQYLYLDRECLIDVVP